MTNSEPTPTGRTLVIGLTGPIGCGKSTIAGWLGERGAVVIDADVLAREVSAPGQEGHNAVLDVFGDAVRVRDGTLDRVALARIVFRDPEALRRLEVILHPLVRARILAARGDFTPALSHAREAVGLRRQSDSLVEQGLALWDQGEVLLLADIEEMKYQEIADVLDVPMGTVMSRLARARKLVREYIVVTLGVKHDM